MDVSGLFGNDLFIVAVLAGSVKVILGNWIQSTFKNIMIDYRWQFGDVTDDLPDYGKFCGPDGNWGLVQFESKCWWRDTIVLYHMTLVDGVFEYSKRTIGYEEFKLITKRTLSPEEKARVKDIVDKMNQRQTNKVA